MSDEKGDFWLLFRLLDQVGNVEFNQPIARLLESRSKVNLHQRIEFGYELFI